jgi:tetratricopeptide (TPR) repeat protein
MKIAFALFFIGSAFALFCSCAGLAPVPARPETAAGEGDRAVTGIRKPEMSPAMERTRTPLVLPQPGLSRREVELNIKAQALRFRDALKSWMRNASLARAARLKTDQTAVAKAKTPQPKVENAAPPVVKPRSQTGDTGARPVASSDDGASPATGQARTIYARLGDDVEISFKENGWLLLEMPPEGAGLSFVSRHIEDGKTLFKLRGQKIGDYVLPFQYQDQAKGTITRQTIEIKVVSQKDFDAAMGSRESDADKEDKAKRRAEAVRLLDLGDYEDALRELLASYSEGDPALNQLIASLALRQRDYRNAILYWQKNLNDKGDWRDKAIAGLVRASLAAGDRNVLPGLARALLAVKAVPIEEELGLLIQYFANLKDADLELDLLQEYLKRYPAGARLAEVYFLLGQLYEFSGTLMDFKKSRECYEAVVKEFPESEYYAPARDRIDFINRHYFRVQ